MKKILIFMLVFMFIISIKPIFAQNTDFKHYPSSSLDQTTKEQILKYGFIDIGHLLEHCRKLNKSIKLFFFAADERIKFINTKEYLVIAQLYSQLAVNYVTEVDDISPYSTLKTQPFYNEQ